MANILIVDDSRTSRKILRGILEDNGHKVVAEARDGASGILLYQELKPDIVTMDVTMPKMDGIEALKKLKEYNPDAKIIMVTAAGQKSKMIEAIKAGASEFVSKPYQAEQMVEIVKKVLES